MRPKTYMLAKAIQERKEVLFGNLDAMFKPQGLKEKEEAWEAVRTEMIKGGFINFERKSWKDVRNHDWQYLRRSAVAKFEHNQKPNCEPIQYSEIDKIVFDIMGNEESSFNDNVYGADSKCLFDSTADSGVIENLLATVLKPSSSFVEPSNFAELPSTSVADEKLNDTNNNSGCHETGTSVSNAESNLLSNVYRKMSWDTNSSNESNKDATKDKNLKIVAGNNNEIDHAQDYFKLLTVLPNTLVEYRNITSGNVLSQLDFLHSLNVMLEKSTVSPIGQPSSQRKRQYSDTLRSKSVAEEIQEAKLQLLLIQVKREEALLQQERAKVEQERAKARQEQVKVELLESELSEKRKEVLNCS